jgi:GvpD gas vesicle protein
MRASSSRPRAVDGWSPIPDPDGRFSTGIPDLDQLVGGGFRRGTSVLLSHDDTVGIEELDLVLFPMLLNMLYRSRGMIAVLPARDSPHGFRARLTRYVTRRRFDSRVRVCDYVGEDEGAPYVVTMKSKSVDFDRRVPDGKERSAALAKMVAAERVAQGSGRKPFVELTAFEVFETLLGASVAMKMYYYALKRTRTLGNLGIGILGPGLQCAAGVRRMVDAEVDLHCEDVGLIVRGIRPAFTSRVVSVDPHAGPPHVALVPRPG